MAYWLFLDHVVFPVAPEKITTKINNKNETIDLIDGSEINLLKKPGLTEYEFELLLPMTKYPFAHYDNGFLDARYYLDVLERLKLEKRHFQFDLYREMPGEKDIRYKRDGFTGGIHNNRRRGRGARHHGRNRIKTIPALWDADIYDNRIPRWRTGSGCSRRDAAADGYRTSGYDIHGCFRGLPLEYCKKIFRRREPLGRNI